MCDGCHSNVHELAEAIGIKTFKRIFQVILTDGGTEFQNSSLLELTIEGKSRTSLCYCDPYSSWQKGMIEKNHVYIRYILTKGTSFEELNQEQVSLIQKHINSEARDSLNGCTPYKLSTPLLITDFINTYI